MATHYSVLVWRIPGTGEPGGLPSMGLHRVGHDWSDLAAVVAAAQQERKVRSHFQYFTRADAVGPPKNNKVFTTVIAILDTRAHSLREGQLPQTTGRGSSVCTRNGGRETPPALVCLHPRCPSSLADDKEGMKPQVLHFLVPWTLGQAEGISEPLLRIMFFSAWCKIPRIKRKSTALK